MVGDIGAGEISTSPGKTGPGNTEPERTPFYDMKWVLQCGTAALGCVINREFLVTAEGGCATY